MKPLGLIRKQILYKIAIFSDAAGFPGITDAATPYTVILAKLGRKVIQSGILTPLYPDTCNVIRFECGCSSSINTSS